MRDETSLSPLMQTELFGHHAVLHQWQQAFVNQKLHHGLLVSGSTGVGKATLVYQFLKWMFKKQSSQPQMIDKQLAAGSYPGLKIIERLFDEKKQRYASEMTLDAVQPIFDFLRLSVIDGGYRAIVIDGADRMNRNAQNTILKLLEEPPAKTFFFLLVEQPGLVLPTIRSRCMSYALPPLTFDAFSDGLARLASNVPEREHDSYYTLSDGSLGQAIDWFEQDWQDIYSETVKAGVTCLNGTTSKAALKWAENYAPASQDNSYDLLQTLLVKRLGQVITALHQNDEITPWVADEPTLITQWRSVPPQTLIKQYDRLKTVLTTGSRSHLDRKLVLLQALQAFIGQGSGAVASAPAKG